jgi:Fe-S-cluster containining protein
MSSTPAEHEWYADGLRFSCTQCGNCCTGPPGTVAFTPEEGRRIAEHLGLDEPAFYERYTHKVRGRWSLAEHRTEHGFDCIFLDRASQPGKAVCGIYAVRPGQCRTWPFWPENLLAEALWEAVKADTPCPGMNRGTLVPIEAIRIQRDAKPDAWLEEEEG